MCLLISFLSNEVGRSYYIEMERVIAFLEKNGLCIKVIVTDRHQQIDKWTRETHIHMEHFYDSWHLAIGIFRMILYTIAQQ